MDRVPVHEFGVNEWEDAMLKAWEAREEGSSMPLVQRILASLVRIENQLATLHERINATEQHAAAAATSSTSAAASAEHAVSRLRVAVIRPPKPLPQPRRPSCNACRSSHLSCSHDQPCGACTRSGKTCVYARRKRSFDDDEEEAFSPQKHFRSSE